MRILGIDPGSVKTGFGLIDVASRKASVVHHGFIATGGGDFPTRLKVIFESLQELIGQYEPDQAAIETVFMHRSAQSALKLGQARGAAICAAATLGLSVAEYEPRLIKQAITGKGGADKVQIQHMVGVLLNIREKLQSDAADALAVALCHQHHFETAARLARVEGLR